jgi:hypothetical protein
MQVQLSGNSHGVVIHSFFTSMSCESVNGSRPGRKRQLIWEHFDEDALNPKRKRAVCKYCGCSFFSDCARMKKHILFCHQVPEIVRQGVQTEVSKESNFKVQLKGDDKLCAVSELTACMSPLPTIKQNEMDRTIPEAVWDYFVHITNDQVTEERIGIEGVKKMISIFKNQEHKESLRSILLLSCPFPDRLPSTASNRPSTMKFIDIYLRQLQFGLFDDGHSARVAL